MSQMRLGEFVTQTLSEIVDGVAGAQEHAEEKGAVINPSHVMWSKEKQGFFIITGAAGQDQAPLLTPIDFEVLLTIGEDDKAQGGVGVFAASLGIGLKGEVKEYTETVNKLKFQVLVKLPQQP